MRIRNGVMKQLRVTRKRIERESNPSKKMRLVREYEVLLETL
jgi:hypothetical protein